MTVFQKVLRMRAMLFYPGICFLFVLPAFAIGQNDAKGPTSEEKQALRRQTREFREQLKSVPDTKQALDLQVCVKAAEWILRHDEFLRPDYLKKTHRVLEIGQQRLDRFRSGNVEWWKSPGQHALAYRSRIDGSIQPYVVTVPESFEAHENKRWPLYIVLHGRNGTLTEASFIANADGKPAPPEQTWIQLDVYGRGNNAYRWAGETDVFEAMADVGKRFKIDDRRITLWGFSMGGAGAWSLGLHHPSKWASAGAGAGFVDFYNYQKKAEPLPDYQHQTLSIYDSDKYALNLSIVPMIGYGGENDSQLVASETIREWAEEFGVPLQTLIGPGMGHKFDPESLKTFMSFLGENNQKGRPSFPGKKEFRFVTYTLKYSECEWLTVHEMEVPYERTTVSSMINDRGELELATKNVTALSVARGVGDTISIDDSEKFSLSDAAGGNLPDVYFVLDVGGWRLLDYDDSLEFIDNPDQQKRPGLQGPIDDAFMEPFVCVTPTGSPWSQNLWDYAEWNLQRFQWEFDKWMRAHPRVVADGDLTDEQMEKHHLILFGDPGNNAVLKKVVDRLPLTWKPDSIEFGGKSYSTQDHAVVLVYPNPLNPRKYVVINSGMTMHEQDFKASNSWLFPKLGDHAVIRFEKTDDGFRETTVSAGIFDSDWNLRESPR
ncbi:MAG: prolyl oligopeptidase family serine peptidase [Planctomycetaceae bacterium]|nr:prolyl oligopeptidase family serine peptidase [Planctomycetaceae bacterium]